MQETNLNQDSQMQNKIHSRMQTNKERTLVQFTVWASRVWKDENPFTIHIILAHRHACTHIM